MRALTVQQPWAWAIIYADKSPENRTRNIAGAYRGPLAIHASKTIDVEAFEHPLIEAATLDASYFLDPDDDRDPFPLGAFIGVVDLVDVHREGSFGGARGDLDGTYACCGPWGERGAWHLGVADPRPLEMPIRCRGALGLWTPPADVLDQLQAMAR